MERDKETANRFILVSLCTPFQAHSISAEYNELISNLEWNTLCIKAWQIIFNYHVRIFSWIFQRISSKVWGIFSGFYGFFPAVKCLRSRFYNYQSVCAQMSVCASLYSCVFTVHSCDSMRWLASKQRYNWRTANVCLEDARKETESKSKPKQKQNQRQNQN